MMRQFKALACVDAEGVVVRKFLLTKVEIGGLHVDAAVDNHFTMAADDQDHWVREIDDEIVALETRHDTWQAMHLFQGTLGLDERGYITASPDFPADTTFRRAWVMVDDKVVHDMDRACDIHRERMRQARAPLLAALDITYSRADAKGDSATKDAVEARRQALRDVTADPAIAAAATPDDLKAVWPAVLGGSAVGAESTGVGHVFVSISGDEN